MDDADDDAEEEDEKDGFIMDDADDASISSNSVGESPYGMSQPLFN